MVDILIKFYNSHFKNKITYEYNDFFDCRLYNFDFEEEEYV